ncbi:hypothetical protein [Methylobacterium nodulans]|nr:hypothetical protein [Methylobacterium nodulans]
MADPAGIPELLRRLALDAAEIGADRNMDVGLALTVLGIDVTVTGVSPRTGQSYSDLRRVKWSELESAEELSAPICEAVQAGVETVTERLKSRR